MATVAFKNLNDPLDREMKRLMKCADFSTRDMTAWLGRPYSTVYQWSKGVVPQPRFYDDIVDRLDVLIFALNAAMLDDCPNQGERRLNYIARTYSRARRAKAAGERAA